MEGKSPYKIATDLQRDKELTGAGGSQWYDSTVNKILKSEKYMGDAPIVSREEFTAVQTEFERRSSMRGYSKTGKIKFTSDYDFSGKLFCQNCGSKFRRTKWGKGKNHQIVWICINHQMHGTEACNMKTAREGFRAGSGEQPVEAPSGIIGSKKRAPRQRRKTLLQLLSNHCGVRPLWKS